MQVRIIVRLDKVPLFKDDFIGTSLPNNLPHHSKIPNRSINSVHPTIIHPPPQHPPSPTPLQLPPSPKLRFLHTTIAVDLLSIRRGFFWNLRLHRQGSFQSMEFRDT